MTKATYLGFYLLLLALIACQAERPRPEAIAEQEFRSQFAGTYQLYRLTQSGTVGQDTTTTFEGFVEMAVTYESSDSLLVFPGAEKLPTLTFGDRLDVALRENGRFVQINHRTIPSGYVEGGFIEPDSIYLYTQYVHGGTEFLFEVLSGHKVN